MEEAQKISGRKKNKKIKKNKNLHLGISYANFRKQKTGIKS